MLVYKFGGTSQATAARMKSVADLVTKDEKQKVVVLSAVSGTTDNLIKLHAASPQQAEILLNSMRDQYETYVTELLNNEDLRKDARGFLASTFTSIKDKINSGITRDER